MKKIIIIFGIFFILGGIISGFFIIKQDYNLENILDKYKKYSIQIIVQNNPDKNTNNIVGNIDKTKEIKHIKSVARGFFIKNNGIILTNYHIINTLQDTISIITNDNKNYNASIIYTDKNLDLLLLKIETKDNILVPKFVQNTKYIEVGIPIYSIGYNYIKKSGNIIGTEKNLQELGLNNLIETNLGLVPGDSGSALINSKGEIIGINTATMNYEKNKSFAIVLDKAKVRDILDKIEKETK